MRQIRPAYETDIPLIRKLAFEIWPPTYGSIISDEQIDYMLNLMYSPEALATQMAEGCRFLILEDEPGPVGFASFQQVAPDEFKLHKLYVLPSSHGKGTGRTLVNKVIEEVKGQGGKTLILQVNKANPAKTFYECLGFTIREEMVLDIGNGFVMDDYIMEKNLGDAG